MLTLENAATAQCDFEILEAANYVDFITIPDTSGATDIDAVIANLGGRVAVAPIDIASGMTIRNNPLYLVVRDLDPACRQRITKAHEIGHYFLEEIADEAIEVSWGKAGDKTVYEHNDPKRIGKEAFCDYFAHRLIGVPYCLTPVLRPSRLNLYGEATTSGRTIRAI